MFGRKPKVEPRPQLKVCLAGRYTKKNIRLLKLYAQQLRALGYIVTSNWHDLPYLPAKDWTHEVLIACFERNIARVRQSDILIALGVRPGGRYAGGDTHDEIATARENGAAVYLIGEPSTCAQHALVRAGKRFATWHECYGNLKMLAEVGRESEEVAA